MAEQSDRTEELIAELRRGDEAGRDRAWEALREELREAPDRLAPRVAEVVAELVEQPGNQAILFRILMVLEHLTREAPESVPGDVLRKVIEAPGTAGAEAVLCAAAIVARQRPKALLDEGLRGLLEAGELVLETSSGERSEILGYLEALVGRLWREVAIRDPSLLADLLSAWAPVGGAGSRLTALFRELLVSEAPRHPKLAADLLAILTESGATGEQIAAVEAIERVERIAAALDPDAYGGRPVEVPPAPEGRPDPGVDRLLELFCDPDPERAQVGWSGVIGRPVSRPLVDGLAEIVTELLAEAPGDRRVFSALFAIRSKTETRPDLVPVVAVEGWLSTGLADDPQTILALTLLARARPDLVVERHLRLALGLSMTGEALARELWRLLGAAAPGLLAQVAREAFAEGRFDSDFGSVLAEAFEPAAVARPDALEDLVDVLREEIDRNPEAEPEPGTIRLRMRPAATHYLERLEALRQGGDG